MMTANDPTPSVRYAWYVVALLTLANISSFIDRQVLSLLVKPIKHDLHLSDTQMSLLMGLSFALFYTLFGMLIGRLADRYTRRNIVIGGITIWSLMTVLCGGIRTYSQFFLARMGVGVGEATLSPSAFSMIADLFPRKQLATALSIFSMGIFLGSGLATLIGSGIVAKLPATGLVTVPIVGQIYPWQLLFFYVGLPGLLIGLLLLTIREPRRTSTLQVAGQTARLSFAESLVLIFRYRTAYLLICFATACQALINYGCNAWVPTFIARTYGWEIPRAGAFYGLVTICASLLGVLFGGWYADKLTKEGHTDGRLRVGVLSGVLALASFFIPLLPRAEWALLAMAMPIFGLACPFGAAAAAIQELMPNQVRGLASAIYLFILNLIGIGLGPTLVALFTDFLFHDEQMIRYSLVLLYAIGGGIGLLLGMLALKPYRRAMADQHTAVLNAQV
ncbi:spinster family MFS transporter [Fibrella arboris]|uniref:spinster family MFS transporter n=1 Tax=Fibrella arboris TaxID=3242486 RepID=UPI003520ABAF